MKFSNFDSYTINTDNGTIVFKGKEDVIVLLYGLQRSARKWNVGLRKWVQDLTGRVFCRVPCSTSVYDCVVIYEDSLHKLAHKVMNQLNLQSMHGEFAVFIGTTMHYRFTDADVARHIARCTLGAEAFARCGSGVGWYSLNQSTERRVAQ